MAVLRPRLRGEWRAVEEAAGRQLERPSVEQERQLHGLVQRPDLRERAHGGLLRGALEFKPSILSARLLLSFSPPVTVGQDPHDCETGVPESCSAECGNKWMPYWKACKGYMEEQFPASMGRKRQKNGGATMFSDFADMCTETMYGSLYRCTGAQDPSFPPLLARGVNATDSMRPTAQTITTTRRCRRCRAPAV